MQLIHELALRPARINFQPGEVVRFWTEAGPERWFAKDPAFDRRFRQRFAEAHQAAAAGRLAGWLSTAEGALALILLLDQYPRNSFRGQARMYATDAAAYEAAEQALRAGHDRACEPELRMFFYLPFAHSERLADQERSVILCRALGPEMEARAEHHRDIVARFGRFPHRNAILGRDSRAEEAAWLADGGFAG